jgi:hypothetical protein
MIVVAVNANLVVRVDLAVAVTAVAEASVEASVEAAEASVEVLEAAVALEAAEAGFGFY